MANIQIDSRALEAWNERLLDLQKAYRESLDILEVSESINYKKGIAESCKILGYCYWRFSDFSLSLSHSLRAIKIFQQLNDKKGEADTLNNIGAVYMFQNEHQKRLEVNVQCKLLREQIGDLEGVISSEGNIGETYFEMEKYDEAQRCFESVLESPHASPQGMAWAHHNLGMIFKVRQDWKKALQSYKTGLEISESVKYTVLITESYIRITELYIELQELDNAIEQAEKALEVSRKIGAKDGEKRALYYLSKIYELKGQFKDSLRYHKDYHTIDIEISRDTEIERLKTTQLRVAFEKIEEQKNELLDSIRYAEQIQKAVLTRYQGQTLLTNYFVFYQAKDIVSGDFYWYFEQEDYYYICVADCTGHGVPGAVLTMLGTTYLNEIVTRTSSMSPAEILDELREHIIAGLSQNLSSGNKDGMDISLLRVNTKKRTAEWAGANNPLWIVRSNQLESLSTSYEVKMTDSVEYTLFELKGDRQSISIMENMSPFVNHSIQLEPKDRVYLFSDGFVDQFGGAQGKKLMSANFKSLLLAAQHLPISKQGEHISTHFNTWKGQYEQVDDVCVLGFEV